MTSGAWKYPTRLTFAVLETFASARLAVLLALFHARIARQQAFGLEDRAQVRINGQQRPGQTMAHGSRLAVWPAARHSNVGIVFVRRPGDRQRLRRSHPQRFRGKIIIEWAAIDHDLAGPSRKADPRDRSFATASAQVFWNFRFGNFNVCHT